MVSPVPVASAVDPGPLTQAQIGAVAEEVLSNTRVIDMHTHLFAPSFGELGLWGIDNLLTYHYLEAELFRFSPIRPSGYGTLSRKAKADLIWKTLFVENAPLSEAARGVIAVLQSLGLDSNVTTLEPLRAFFRQQDLESYLPLVLERAGVSSVVLTNDPLDPAEAAFWQRPAEPDPRFRAALRLDRVLNHWDDHHQQIAAQGYAVDHDASSPGELRRFLEDWCSRMNPAYMAVSLPDSFQYAAIDVRNRLLTDAVLPTCRELNLPLALMIGVRRQVNPALLLAGDASGRADLRSLETLCTSFPDNRFLVSVLSRENQHELCVYARKFANLLPFGCRSFLNNSSVVEEITRERLEMLGASFIAQNSDARVLEQLIYKWHNTRRNMAPLIAAQFQLLAADGRAVRRSDIEATVTRLFRGNFEAWT